MSAGPAYNEYKTELEKIKNEALKMHEDSLRKKQVTKERTEAKKVPNTNKSTTKQKKKISKNVEIPIPVEKKKRRKKVVYYSSSDESSADESDD
jgi:hypothetical protein